MAAIKIKYHIYKFVHQMTSEPFHIVLVEPEIPQNTGSIARLCGAVNGVLDLVHPLGFKIDDKHLKRAGLDYWPHVDIRNWENFEAFLAAADEQKLFLFTTKVERSYFEASFPPGSCFVFGKETKGLPENTIELYRSLNLAMCAGIVLYEAIRQQSVSSSQ